MLAGCASATPPLPLDTTSVNRSQWLTAERFSPEDRESSCAAIAREYESDKGQVDDIDGRIQANRLRNQIAGSFAELMLLPIVFTVSSDLDNQEVLHLYERQDVLMKLFAFKNCPGRESAQKNSVCTFQHPLDANGAC